MLACMNGHHDVAEFLLEQEADITVINKVRYPLTKENTVACIEFIIKWKEISQTAMWNH